MRRARDELDSAGCRAVTVSTSFAPAPAWGRMRHTSGRVADRDGGVIDAEKGAGTVGDAPWSRDMSRREGEQFQRVTVVIAELERGHPRESSGSRPASTSRRSQPSGPSPQRQASFRSRVPRSAGRARDQAAPASFCPFNDPVTAEGRQLRAWTSPSMRQAARPHAAPVRDAAYARHGPLRPFLAAPRRTTAFPPLRQPPACPFLSQDGTGVIPRRPASNRLGGSGAPVSPG